MKASFFLQTKSWEPCETKEYSYDKGMLHIRINGIESSTTEGLEEEVLGGFWKGAGEHCNDKSFVLNLGQNLHKLHGQKISSANFILPIFLVPLIDLVCAYSTIG